MKKILLSVVVVITVGVAYLYLNSGNLVKALIERQGSAATGVTVTVDAVELDILNGAATIRGLRVGNPKGYKSAHALSVDVITVGLDAASVSKPVLTITKIYVEKPVLTYETVDGTSNFDVIRKNAEKASGDTQESAPDTDAKTQKFIIKLVKFTEGQVTAVGFSPVGDDLNAALPGFKVRDIGRAEGGLSAGGIAARLTVAITTQVIKGVVAGALFDVTGDTLRKVKDILPGLKLPGQ